MGMTQKIAAKPLTPEKLQEVMLKIRKGATSSLTMSQISAVLNAIGGSLGPTVGATPAFYQSQGIDSRHAYAETDAGKDAVIKNLERHQSPVPSNPKLGVVYVTEIRTPQGIDSPYSKNKFVIEYKAYVGVAGIRVSLGGASGDVLPSAHDGAYDMLKPMDQGGSPDTSVRIRDVSPSEIVRWLIEHNWKEKVNAYLNMEEHVPAAQRTRDSTGTCSVCFQNVKIQPGSQLPLIVLHGYKRPRYGYVIGRCEGTRYPPFELSIQGTENYLEKGLKSTEKDFDAKLASLKADDLETLTVRTRVSGPKVLHKGDPDWDKYLNISIENISGLLGQVREDIKIYTLLVQHWKERPLPREGEKLHDWYTEGRKASLQESVVLRHLASIVARRHLAR